jgi:hypothetical protein
VSRLFDRERGAREPKQVLLNTTEEAAYEKGKELDAPIIAFVGAELAPQSESDLWIAGICFAKNYGEPSQRIKEQLGRRAIKEVIYAGLEAGVKALGMKAGQA